MANVLAMFPGQGSQFVGMGRHVLDQFPKTKVVFEEAEDAAKLNIRSLCLEGPEDDLKLTANTQPCILSVSVAVWRALHEETGLRPSFFAGHSLGEYSALVAAGKLDLGRAAMLVRKRGEAMQEAVPAGTGAMAAVMNMPANDLEAQCQKISRPGAHVGVVNYNSPQQLVVAGHKSAVDVLAKELEGVTGVRAVMLPVSAPFHSPLMSPAREKMAPLLSESKFHNNDTKVIANLTGKIAADYNADMLIGQIDSPVLWTQTMETANQLGSTIYLEVGPGKVLFGLARRTLPRGEYKLLHTEDLIATISEVSTAIS